MEYDDFVANKRRAEVATGHQPSDLNEHMCPLQLDVIERCIHLWTNENDLVFSPFTGIGSEGYYAVKMGRRFVGTELKPQYYELACQNIEDAQREQKGLFA